MTRAELSSLLLVAYIGLSISCPSFSGENGDTIVVECSVGLGSPAISHPIKITADHKFVTVTLPNVLDASISTVTYTFQMHLKALGMNRTRFREKFSDRDVLLVGEGFGALLPELLKVGARVKAVDPLYSLSDVTDEAWNMNALSSRPLARKTINEIRKYLRKYKEYLIPGLSSSLPLPSGSFDYVISSMLINNFKPVSQTLENVNRAKDLMRMTILDSVRVLKQSGQAIHVFAMTNAQQFADQILVPSELANLQPETEIQTSLTGPVSVDIEYQDTNGGYRSFDSEKKQMWTLMARHK